MRVSYEPSLGSGHPGRQGRVVRESVCRKDCRVEPGGRVISGRYAGRTVDVNVFQRTVDYPEEFAMGFHVVLDDETLVTVRRDQVAIRRNN